MPGEWEAADGPTAGELYTTCGWDGAARDPLLRRCNVPNTAFCPRFLKTENCKIRTLPPTIRSTAAQR